MGSEDEENDDYDNDNDDGDEEYDDYGGGGPFGAAAGGMIPGLTQLLGRMGGGAGAQGLGGDLPAGLEGMPPEMLAQMMAALSGMGPEAFGSGNEDDYEDDDEDDDEDEWEDCSDDESGDGHRIEEIDPPL